MNDWRGLPLEILRYAALAAAPVILILAVTLEAVRRRRAHRAGPQAARDARDKIMADGKVEGPKGPYVPHEKWEAPSQKPDNPKFKGPHGPAT